jgi:hypothetical protein
MPKMEVPIREIVADPDHSTDLSTLPRDDILARLEMLSGLLPTVEGVSIAGDTGIVTIREDNPYRVEEALRTYKHAGRTAERGNHQACNGHLSHPLRRKRCSGPS